jgi:hypothetical protein
VVVKLVRLVIDGFVGGAASEVVTTTGGKAVGIPKSLIAVIVTVYTVELFNP